MAVIMVLTARSTGDVEPFATLAGALARRGHAVTLAADAEFERPTPGEKVDFEAIRADFHPRLPTPERKRPSVRRDVFPVIQGMLEDCWIAARSVR
jgi:UDP:flavonoid glycosyltransferase YjiC (YdhE family)